MVKIVISGAGPAGLLLAHHLVKRPGYDVHVFEKRQDPVLLSRKEDRTYPIGLQPRGMTSVREIPTLESKITSFGKWITEVSVNQGGKKQMKFTRPPNFMIERNDLVLGMLEHLRDYSKEYPDSSVFFHWEKPIESVFLHNRTVAAVGNSYETFDYLVAADGANSAVRNSLASQPQVDLEVDVEPVPDDYKSFFLQLQSADGEMSLERTSMHGWRVGANQIISVPLKEEYGSGVYIFPRDQNPFETFQTPNDLLTYFSASIPGMAEFVSEEEAAAFLKRPSNRAITVKCSRLVIQDCVVLLGDAAHAVSPSLGQGCNSALEDVRVLNRLLVDNSDDWKLALSDYDTERLAQAHAVHELSDYYKPRTKRMRIEFLVRLTLRKVLPNVLAKKMRPLPTDIMYDENLSYSEMLAQCKWWTDRVKKTFPVAKNANLEAKK